MRDLPLTYRWDHNRDGWVSPADLAAVLRNSGAPLRMFTVRRLWAACRPPLHSP